MKIEYKGEGRFRIYIIKTRNSIDVSKKGQVLEVTEEEFKEIMKNSRGAKMFSKVKTGKTEKGPEEE